MENASKKNVYVRGALILSAGGLAAKILGAFYRIPLTNILGARGMGLYQLVFPMYALLLTVGSTGLNTAVSRLTAEKEAAGDSLGAKNVLRSALWILGIFGMAGSLLLLLLGGVIAAIQAEPAAASAYRAISPSVVLVCLIAAFRGYFQGRQKMSPTALSQVIEQAVKMTVSLWAASRLMPDVVAAATGAVWAVTVSEAVALCYLVLVYALRRKKEAEGAAGTKGEKTARRLILLALPITMSGIILPLTQLFDSALVLNIIGGYRQDATVLFGLLSGPVNSLIALPVAVTLGFATASVPAVSRLRVQGKKEEIKKKCTEALGLTLAFSIPAAAAVFFLAEFVIGFLYRALPESERLLAASLLKTASAEIIFLSFLSAATSLLHALGRIYAPVKNLAAAAVVKIVLNLLLLSRPAINIYGAALSTLCCYFIAAVLDFASLRKALKKLCI